MPKNLIIVGASMAGLRVAEQLVSLVPDVSLMLLGDEPHRPYNRPPLSKEFLGGADLGEAARDALSF
ncbi:FAD-dependent oxidoreductase, partial [Streptococcus pneumoniae]|uniref:FAD-dependent oxidoreductase n=1 Tax=Streptococcus pneumoniae TaxID=1313 RepID=UPI001953D4AB